MFRSVRRAILWRNQRNGKFTEPLLYCFWKRNNPQIRNAGDNPFLLLKPRTKTTENLERTDEMRQTLTTLKFLTVIALLAVAVGCASEGENKQNLAIAAGFKIITPKNAEQQSILTQLPKDQVTPVDYKGKRYYVLPDVANNQAYVGGAEQYQAYQQLRLAQHLSNQNLEAAQMNQMATMNWGAWGGWGGYGGWGWR